MFKSKKKLTMLILLMILSNILIIYKVQLKNPTHIDLKISVKSDKNDTYQIFYSEDSIFLEDKSQKDEYSSVGKFKELSFTIPTDIKLLRIDTGNNEGKIFINYIKFRYLYKEISIPLTDIKFKDSNDIKNINHNDGVLSLESTGQDPNIVFDVKEHIYLITNNEIVNFLIKIVFCVLIDIMLLVLINKSGSVLQLVTDLNSNRVLIWNLAKNDFKTKYAGSYLGIIWAFINPVITILIYWFVFQYGLKAGSPIQDTSFIFWLMSGLIPWFFFQDALINATNCMIEYSYLVKKVVFKISVLPIIKIISAIFVHLAFIIFLLIVGLIQGKYPDVITLQILYYSGCTFFLVLGLSYATSSIILFFRDLSQLIGIFLQVGMWMTPIMWSYSILPDRFQWLAKLNPMYYIVEGYRDTLINKVWFWDRYFQTVYFWVLAIGIFVLGSIIFKKLKPHFSDVL
ncbi:ABC-2 type transporter [Peptostreptococcaceae bacterium AS15]|nr:ABC-2 type transporter [Peptostreptococcaceae bacterium AS15]